MNYYGANDWRDYHLAHWGVKGMKWGKHVKAATDWWSKNVTGDYYRNLSREAANQASTNLTRRLGYFNKAKSHYNDKDSYRGFAGKLKRNAIAAKYVAKSDAERVKYHVNSGMSDYYRAKDRTNKTIGQKAKEAPGKAARSIGSGAKKIGNAFVDSARSNGRKFKAFTKKNAPKADKAVRSGIKKVSSGAKSIGNAFVDSATTNGKKFKEFTKKNVPKADKAVRSGIKKVSSGAKSIGKAFADNARSNGRKFKEFTKSHTPKADKAIRSGVKRVQKALGRLTGKSTTTAKSSSNRPHSRKPKIASGTANVEKRKNLASRPHSRKPKIASGTAQVKKKRRVTYG